MSGFSEDGRWWWDGATWIPTSQVVLPQLPQTEFERSGKLQVARDRRKEGRRVFWKHMFIVGLLGLTPSVDLGVREYRSWTLEQLALATSYLLGPDEPMLAGEVSIYDVLDSWSRGLAIAVTAVHVLVFWIDSVGGQPRTLKLAARLRDVRMERFPKVFEFLGPALFVSGWNGRWTINGYKGAFDPEPVLDAWRKAANRASTT